MMRGMTDRANLRHRAVEIFEAGVAAADPYAAVTAALTDDPVKGTPLVLAIGKAARRMAEAALAQYPRARAIVVTNYENAVPLAGATVLAAGHPVPDENGANAAAAVMDALSALTGDDTVLALISGGGSALLPAPVDGVSLADKAAVNRALLASGADITQMNMVRQHLSRLKGGGLLRMAAPAKVRALILSDVMGDDLRVIASGPTVAPIGTRATAKALLQDKGVWDALPAPVRLHLDRADDTDTALPGAENILIGSNPISVAAMKQAAPDAAVHPRALEGDVAEAAAEIIATCTGKGITLFGGETTVLIKGAGLGGRNQELALRVALAAKDAGWTGDWVFLSGGTDGRDGPTDAAGGLVDYTTLSRMGDAGIDPVAVLADNDSYHGLKAVGDLLMTGATGTNVADLQVLIRR